MCTHQWKKQSISEPQADGPLIFNEVLQSSYVETFSVLALGGY